MKYFFSAIACFFALQNFAQHNLHSPAMSKSMHKSEDNFLPAVISNAIIKSWGASNLFKTVFDTSSLVYLAGEQEHIITIRAFQQQFYDDPKVLKPVWVLGYTTDESTQPPVLPGPVIISEYAKPTKIFWVNKTYETLQNQPAYQLYPTFDTQKKSAFRSCCI